MPAVGASGLSAASGQHSSAEKYFITSLSGGVSRRRAMGCFSASAPAKAIIVGEHFVVWGSKALATALSLRAAVRLCVRAGGPEVRISSRELGLRCLVWPKCDCPELRNLHAVVAAAQSSLGLKLSESVNAEVSSPIPIAAGLGSSAAVAVAFAAALMLAYYGSVERDAVNRLAYEAERVAHGRPSGIDNTVATYGGTIIYSRRAGFERLNTKLNEAVLLVVDSGQRRATRKAVERALRFRDRLGPGAGELVAFVDRLVDLAVSAARAGNFDALGAVMNLAHGMLVGVGVSTPALDRIVEALRSEPGVYGAKLTGAGLGGVVIALVAPDAAEDAASRVRPLAKAVFAVGAEEEGVREEA